MEGASGAFLTEEGMKQRHLIVIVADQLRWDVLGRGYTPHLDALAAESVTFRCAYCASPLCVPARGALFTGLCPNSNGSRINPWFAGDAAAGNVRKGIPNLYSLLAEQGWDCMHSGKQHLFTEGGKLEEDPDTAIRWLSTEQTYKAYLARAGKRAPGGPRFRTPVPEMASGLHTRVCSYSNAETGCYPEGTNCYFDGYFTDCAIQGLRERDTSRPLFLSMMFLAPHPPLEIPEPWYSRVSQAEVALPDNVGSWYPYQSPLQLYNLPGVVGSRYTRAQWRETWRVYLGLVGLLDDCVGRLIAELKRQHLYEDSLILFTSDHGEMLGSHRLFQKMCMYEEAARVPLFLRLPGDACGGRRVEQTVSHIDVLPTLCHYLGIPAPPCEGVSLAPLVENRTPGTRRDVFLQFDGNGALGNFQRCIVRENWKLIVDIFKDEVYFELYNTGADPQETTNLLFEEENLSRAEALLQALRVHMAKTGDTLRLPAAGLREFVETYRGLAARQGGKG